MKINQPNQFQTGLVTLKNNDWLDRQRIAGRAVTGTLNLLRSFVEENRSMTLRQMSEAAEDYIRDNQCTATFKGYRGFPAAVCISVNKQLVHGIPGDQYISDGDIVSFDLGCTFDGAIADAAITVVVNQAKSSLHRLLIDTTRDALNKAIDQIRVGQRLGSIGYSIDKLAKSKGFHVITEYGGHGLDENKPHAPPFVSNRGRQDEGIRFAPGMTIAIEPLLALSNAKTKVSQDGWTVTTENVSAHFEKTIFIHEDRVETITDW